MAKKLYLFAVLFLVFALISVSNAMADFSIESQLETNTVCPSNTIIINEIISSTTDSSYSVSLSGSASSFTTAVPSGFFLASGQQQTVFLYITPSSRVTPGSYSLTFQVTSQGVTKTVSHSVIVENCHSTSIIVQPAYQEGCTCEQKSYQLTVKNNGKYLENYNLEASGPLSSYTTFSMKTFALSPNQSINMNSYVNAPCNIAGDYDLTFKVNADSKYAQTEATSELNLLQCYDYTFVVEKNLYETCENQKLTIPVALKNLGTQENTYSIKLTGPAWVSADQKSLKIAAGQEKSFNILAQPPLKTLGNSTVQIEFVSEKGAISQKLNLDFIVGSCYGSTLSIEKKEDTLCNGMSSTYNVLIKNTGKFENDFSIALEAPAWVSLSKNQVSLGADEESTLVLTVAPTNDVKPTAYSILLRSTDLNNIQVQDSLSLTTVTQESCYKPLVTSEKDKITVSQETPATVLFTIENKGLKSADYLVELSGTASSFCLINPSTISLEPGKAQTLYLYIFPPTGTKPDEYTLTLTSRLKDSAISSRKDLLITVTGEIPNETVVIPDGTNQTIEKPKKSFWRAIADFFASIFKPANKTNTNETATNHAPVLKKDIPDITMDSGDKFTVNLSKYFSDPDKDKLQFITLKPENMNVLIKGNEITLSAPSTLTGQREVTFYASDGQEMVSSNTVKITIVGTENSEPGEQEETTEEQDNETLSCNDYYYFDNTNKKCDSKEFCGLYMYKGLRTFTTKEECLDNLPEVSENATIENETVGNESTNGTETTPATQPSFFAQYRSYFILAIIVAILIILIFSGVGKKILAFFEEEPEKKKK